MTATKLTAIISPRYKYDYGHYDRRNYENVPGSSAKLFISVGLRVGQPCTVNIRTEKNYRVEKFLCTETAVAGARHCI